MDILLQDDIRMETSETSEMVVVFQKGLSIRRWTISDIFLTSDTVG
jgi:hypothetical protein